MQEVYVAQAVLEAHDVRNVGGQGGHGLGGEARHDEQAVGAFGGGGEGAGGGVRAGSAGAPSGPKGVTGKKRTPSSRMDDGSFRWKRVAALADALPVEEGGGP
ncbi:hypothetical protein GCM10009850_013090 [Nonomuraea monospora]|uniref:Uncharacterized protein n=1 Tax=Nonomuraea monospora TaxID=568818 RepID=A0ABN3C926_9ACTN